jgi:thioredoxin-related protein
MSKKRLMIFTFFFFVVSAALPALAEIQWQPLAEGLKKASSEQKPIIIDFFYGKGCPRCENLEKNVYSNPEIAKKISADFVAVRVDLSKKLSPEETDLGNQYDFKNDCLLIFLDRNGKLVKDPGGKKLCFVDYIEPEQFVKYLDMVKEKLKDTK